jgi:alpha-L-fucosidase
MKVNGESIYGTTYGPLQDLSFGRTTAKGNTVYLHVFDWPAGGRLEAPGLEARITRVRILANEQSLKFKQTARVITIEGPQQAPDPSVSVLELTTS